MSSSTKLITLGGGCFWCLQHIFQLVIGVNFAKCGYSGGEMTHPNYKAICTGHTGHAEVVQISYDENEIPLIRLLTIFFALHNPTQLNRQGADIGTQYRSIILYSTDEDKKICEKVIREEQKSYSIPIRIHIVK
ncbi:hypothetical protein SNEBB_006762 [Seison nebaliae]|nr:hypothetical protein SNEBB_006762 [Seison nebaliae]